MDTEFNAQAFMAETMEMPQLDTKLDPVPVGEHAGQIGLGDKDVDIVVGEKNGKKWMRLVCLIELTDPNLMAQMKRDTPPKVRYDCFIDLDASGRIDTRPQKNVKLGKLRDAVGQNKPGNWSFMNLKGAPIKVKVGHRPDDNDPTILYSEVQAITKL